MDGRAQPGPTRAGRAGEQRRGRGIGLSARCRARTPPLAPAHLWRGNGDGAGDQLGSGRLPSGPSSELRVTRECRLLLDRLAVVRNPAVGRDTVGETGDPGRESLGQGDLDAEPVVIEPVHAVLGVGVRMSGLFAGCHVR